MAVDPEVLQAIFARIEAKKDLSKRELKLLVEAARSQQVTIATGDRVVAIEESADGAVIITGDSNIVSDHNIVVTGANAEAFRELMGKRPREQKSLLSTIKREIFDQLENSLSGAFLIPLMMESQPDQVKREREFNLRISDKASKSIPQNQSILQTFDEMQGKLLILGDPGSGKSTTMLELAKELCERAKRDTEQPIPLLFNLASWNNKRKTIYDWLLSELDSKYGVQSEVGRQWLKDKCLLPMLDGLDEVEPKYQTSCVQAINQFLHSEFRSIFLVVGCRQEVYQKVIREKCHNANYQLYEETDAVGQETRLHLNGCVLIRPLTDQQIQEYLL